MEMKNIISCVCFCGVNFSWDFLCKFNHKNMVYVDFANIHNICWGRGEPGHICEMQYKFITPNFNLNNFKPFFLKLLSGDLGYIFIVSTVNCISQNPSI